MEVPLEEIKETIQPVQNTECAGDRPIPCTFFLEQAANRIDFASKLRLTTFEQTRENNKDAN